VVIEATYDGEDLAGVAELTGTPIDEVVRRHLAASYVVAFTGFAPGFAYLAGGDPALVVPRRDPPRTRVPAGGLALAGEVTGRYPHAGPGGWQLIGRTDAVLWDLGRAAPALLAPGTRVRFTEVGS
jgi:KipI family sensor histidine kinase inhibitor